LINILNVIFWFIMLAWVTGRPTIVDSLFPPLTLHLPRRSVSIFVGLIGAQALGKPHLWWAALLAPCMGVSVHRRGEGIVQLNIPSVFWEKTGARTIPRQVRLHRQAVEVHSSVPYSGRSR